MMKFKLTCIIMLSLFIVLPMQSLAQTNQINQMSGQEILSGLMSGNLTANQVAGNIGLPPSTSIYVSEPAIQNIVNLTNVSDENKANLLESLRSENMTPRDILHIRNLTEDFITNNVNTNFQNNIIENISLGNIAPGNAQFLNIVTNRNDIAEIVNGLIDSLESLDGFDMSSLGNVLRDALGTGVGRIEGVAGVITENIEKFQETIDEMIAQAVPADIVNGLVENIADGSIPAALLDTIKDALPNLDNIADAFGSENFLRELGITDALENFTGDAQELLKTVAGLAEIRKITKGWDGIDIDGFLQGFPDEAIDQLVAEFGSLEAVVEELAKLIGGGINDLSGGGGSSGGSCSFPCTISNNICKSNCQPTITKNHNEIRKHVSDEFAKHRDWLETELLQRQILPAMGMMASQMSTIAMQQVNMIGAFFDAKHQLETQRLFQRLTAEAHEDYQPTEGLCVVGTASRSLNASERKSKLVQNALSQRIMDRQLRSGASVSALDDESDFENRLRQFVQVYCNKADNTNGLSYLCANGGNNPPRMNKDINFTRTIDTNLTLDIDFVDPPTPLTEEEEEAREDDPLLATNDNADKEDVMALMANLFAHTPLPPLSPLELATSNGQPRAMAYRYMDYRSLAAKRSVAQNSFVAMMAERSSGDTEVAPYIKKIVTELGLSPEDTEEVLGERPSYFAQMEVLTKKLYQNPNFYTQLYDKPANVLRKGAAVQAISLMQQRDLFESQLRSEAVIAVMLETMLRDEKRRLDGKLQDINDGVNR